jgi:iron complex transport system substrate-binding protein
MNTVLSFATTSLLAASRATAATPVLQTDASWPRTLTDAMGRSVFIHAPPQRIVTVFPSNVEIVFALGLASRVVAIGGRVRFPQEAIEKPSIGGALGYSPEVVAQHRPDLIVITPSHHTAMGLIEPFSRLGVPVLVLAHPDMAAMLRNIDLVGHATGTEQTAQLLRTQMQSRLSEIRRRWTGRPLPTVYLETAAAARGAFQTIGTGHYASDALAWAGGRNVFSDLSASVQVSAEAIAIRNPDVIISLQQSPKSPVLIGERPGWHRLRAVQTGRVVVMERGHKLIPGPRQIDAVLAYAQALHTEVFV